MAPRASLEMASENWLDWVDLFLARAEGWLVAKRALPSAAVESKVLPPNWKEAAPERALP